MEKFLSVTEMRQDKIYVPFIRIAGKYLQKFNFNKSDKVFISVKPNEIIIKKMSKQQTIDYLCSKNPAVLQLIKRFDLE